MRRVLSRAGVGVLGLTLPVVASAQVASLPKSAVTQATTKTAAKSTAPKTAAGGPAEKIVALPVRRVSLYKNGVGFFEQSGAVSGNELLRFDFSTAQLNDALQSLVAVDSGDGKIAGAEYDSQAPIPQQVALLAPGLGPDPTMAELFHALKGAKVEVRSPQGTFAGRLVNVEVTLGVARRDEPATERRMVSVLTDGGGVRTLELTPSVEVRLVGPEHQEVGRYLQLLSTVHNPTMRHLTLEDRGTGERRVEVSYLSAVPAWKSSYRILFNNDAKGKATLQGWAMVDNTGATDWENVQLTLVSGAPQSFIQQISRPFQVQRPEVALPLPGGAPAKATPLPRAGVAGGMGARFDPVSQGGFSSSAMSAKAIGGGAGVEVMQVAAGPAGPAKGDEYEGAAKRSMTPDVSSVALDDLFEYKLDKPITIRSNQSALVPLLETEVDAERVTIWNPREFPGQPRRALWIRNTSNLTLDRGSFSAVEAGMFGGEGQIDLMHPNERKLVPFGVDEAVSVEFKESKSPPAPKAGHVVVANGRLTVHREYLRVRNYTIHNTSSSARTVVLEPERTDTFRMEPGSRRIASQWHLVPGETAADMTPTEYRFEVPVAPSASSEFKLVEAHTHPVHYQLSELHEDELRGLLKEVQGNPELVAKLQPLLDAKHRLAELGKQLKANQVAADAVKAEERRIRENMAVLNGRPGEQALSKRYDDEMNAQEDRIGVLNKERDGLLAEQAAAQRTFTDEIAGLSLDVKVEAKDPAQASL